MHASKAGGGNNYVRVQTSLALPCTTIVASTCIASSRLAESGGDRAVSLAPSQLPYSQESAALDILTGLTRSEEVESLRDAHSADLVQLIGEDGFL